MYEVVRPNIPNLNDRFIRASHSMLAAAQPRILFRRVQSMTSSVTGIFLTVENWYKAPAKIVCFRRGNDLFGLMLAALCIDV